LASLLSRNGTTAMSIGWSCTLTTIWASSMSKTYSPMPSTTRVPGRH